MPLKELDPLTPDEEAEQQIRRTQLYESRAPASCGWVAKFGDSLMDALAEHISDLRKAVRELENRALLLEETALRYEGTWGTDGKSFTKGAIVTDKGTIWHCESAKPTTDRPGTSSDWKMMAKSNIRGNAK